MSSAQTMPSEEQFARIVNCGEKPGNAGDTHVGTGRFRYVQITVVAQDAVSNVPIHRSRHFAPRVLDNETLRRIAAKNHPPGEWFDGDVECPF